MKKLFCLLLLLTSLQCNISGTIEINELVQSQDRADYSDVIYDISYRSICADSNEVEFFDKSYLQFVKFDDNKDIGNAIEFIDFDLFSSLNPFEENQSAKIKLYRTSYDEIADDARPGKLIYESDYFKLVSGHKTVRFKPVENIFINRDANLAIEIELKNISKICKIGVVSSGKVTEGDFINSYNYVNNSWVKIAQGTSMGLMVVTKQLPIKSNITQSIEGDSNILNIQLRDLNVRENDWYGIYRDNEIPGAINPRKWGYIKTTSTSEELKVVFNFPPSNYVLYYFSGNSLEFIHKNIFAFQDIYPPRLKLIGDKTINLNLGDAYNEPGVDLYSPLNEGDNIELYKEGIIDINKAGSYEIKYTAIDSSGNKSAPIIRNVNVVKGKAKWTILNYIHADHNLTRSAFADIAEIEKSEFNADINVVAQLDINSNERSKSFLEIKYNTDLEKFRGVSRISFNRNTSNNLDIKSIPSETLDESDNNMDDPKVFKSFLDWAIKNYPAERYGLVMWNHGAQFVGFGGDTQDGKLNSPFRMTTGSISNEIKLLIDENENIDSFDFISFDSCLMGGVEILSDFSGLCDVLFANAELDYGKGWDYENSLNILNSDPDIDILEFSKLSVNFWDAHHNTELDKVNKVHAAFKMEEFVKFKTYFSEFTNLLNNELEGNHQNLAKIRSELVNYSIPPRGSKLNLTNYIDLGEFLFKLKQINLSSELIESINNLSAIIDDLIISTSLGSARSGVNGLSISYPFDINDWSSKYEAIYRRLLFSKSYGEGWLEYMSNIGVMTKKDQIPPRLQSGYYSEEFNSGFTGDLIIPEASPNNPVTMDFYIKGNDTDKVFANIAQLNPDNENEYFLLGQIGTFEVFSEGMHNISWPGTNVFIANKEYSIRFPGWFIDDSGEIMLSYADYQPPGVDYRIQLYVFTKFDLNGYGEIISILEDSGQSLPNNNSESSVPSSSGIQLEVGGKLWPAYSSITLIDGEWEYNEFIFEDTFINIDESLSDENSNVFIDKELPGNYSIEVEAYDYNGNFSQILEYYIDVDDQFVNDDFSQYWSTIDFVSNQLQKIKITNEGDALQISWPLDSYANHTAIQSLNNIEGNWETVEENFQIVNDLIKFDLEEGQKNSGYYRLIFNVKD